MFKRTLFKAVGIVLSILILFSVTALTVSAYEGYDPFAPNSNYEYLISCDSYEDYSSYRVYITNYIGSDSEVVVPSYIEGYPVKGVSGFAYNENITSVTIPEGIGEILVETFKGCTNLSYVELPYDITAIQDRAFQDCTSLESIYIPDGVTLIGSDAFKGCTSLSEITIPSSVETVEFDAFYGCSNLTSVTFETSANAGTKSIESRAFAYCTKLNYVKLPNTITELSDLFFGCSGLKSITIPNGIEKIADGAFSECTSLNTVSLPDSLTNIGGHAFYHCPAMTTVKVLDSNPAFKSVDGVLFNKDMTNLIYYPAGKANESYAIPSGVTNIGEYAFNYAQNLKSVDIPDSCKNIGEFAFRYCTNIESVSIPENASISFAGFDQCSGLTALTLPSSVTNIDPWGFSNCTSLADVYYLGTRTQWNSLISTLNSTNDCLKNANIHFIYDCAELEGNSITLFGDIGVNFYMNLADDTFADEDATVIFTYDNNVVKVPVSDGEDTTNGYKYTCNIPAKDMMTEVTCKVETSEGESETYTYTVKEYAEIILANPDTYGEKAVALVKSMLNYGAAAQTYFGYNTETLANDTEYMTEADRNVSEKDFSNLSFTLTEGAGEVKYYGTALSLKSEVGIKHYFTVDDTVNVEELEVTVDGEKAELKKNGTLYEVLIPNIAAHNLYKKYDVTVGDVSVSYCVMDYAANAQAMGKQEILNVMYCLDVYAQNAIAYIN